MIDWIPIKDRKPPRAVPILIGRDDSAGMPAAMSGFFDGAKFNVLSERLGWVRFMDPTHWAEFPAPPSSDDREQGGLV